MKTTGATNTRTAIYARISSDRDDTRLGVDRQLKDCRQLASERGWNVVAEFVDNDISAASGKHRPQYEKMVSAIEGHQIDAVVVWDLDRLTRRPVELEEFVSVCEKADVSQLAFVGGEVDLGTGDGILAARIKGAVAAEEIRKTQQRQRRKKLELAEKGRPNGGGRRAFGWERDGLTIREAEAALIRDAAQRVLMGESLRSITMEWERLEVPTVGGGQWKVNSLKATLRNPRNTGLRQHRGEVHGEAEWPAIIDRDTWTQLQVIFNDPTRARRTERRSYPLRGVLRCGECKQMLTSVPRKKPIPSDPDRRLRYYGCRRDIGGCGKIFVTADHAEAVVKATIVGLVDRQDVRDLARSEQADEEAEIRELLQANAKDGAKLAELEDAFAEGDLSRAGLKKNAASIRGRIEDRTSRIAELRGTSMLDRFDGLVGERWDELTADEQRTVALSLVTTVDVTAKARGGFNTFDPDRLVFRWRWPAVAQISAELLARLSLQEWDSMTDAEKNKALKRDEKSLTPEERGLIHA